MVGKLGISAAYSSIYLMSAELFPTVIRNFGMGCSSSVGRVGSAVSPYIADLVSYDHCPVPTVFRKLRPLSWALPTMESYNIAHSAINYLE